MAQPTVKIATNLTRTSDGVDPKTGKLIRKIFHPNGKIEIWLLDGAYNPIQQLQ